MTVNRQIAKQKNYLSSSILILFLIICLAKMGKNDHVNPFVHYKLKISLQKSLKLMISST